MSKLSRSKLQFSSFQPNLMSHCRPYWTSNLRGTFQIGLIWTWQAYYYSSIIEDLLCLSRAWLMRLADNVQHISVNNYIWLFTQKHFKVCLHLVAQTCFSLWLFSHFETLISHSTSICFPSKKTVIVSPTLLLCYAKWNISFSLPDDAVDQRKLGVTK